MLKHRITWRSAVLAVAAPAAVVAAVGTASASLNTNAVQVVGSGDGGYSVTNGVPFQNAGASIQTTTQTLNIGTPNGTSNTGGTGLQLCDPNNGFGAQVGEVSNGTSFDVEYAVGTLAGAASDNCVGDPLLAGANHLHATTLDNIPVGHTVDVYASFKNVKVTTRHPGHWTGCSRWHKGKKHWVKDCHWHKAYNTTSTQGRVKFQAQDESGFEVYASPWIATAADWNLTEAGFGVLQETNDLSPTTPIGCPGSGGVVPATPPCSGYNGGAAYNGTTGPNGSGASNKLVGFPQFFVNGFGLALPPLPGSPPLGAYNIHEVATTGNGLDTNAATVAPDNSLNIGGWSGDFAVYVGQVNS